MEWRELQEATEKKEEREAKKIHKVDQGRIRIKTSSSLENMDKMGAIGITAMDETERITHAWLATREGSCSPVAADLEAIRCALTLAQQQGWMKIEAKVDVKAIGRAVFSSTLFSFSIENTN